MYARRSRPIPQTFIWISFISFPRNGQQISWQATCPTASKLSTTQKIEINTNQIKTMLNYLFNDDKFHMRISINSVLQCDECRCRCTSAGNVSKIDSLVALKSIECHIETAVWICISDSNRLQLKQYMIGIGRIKVHCEKYAPYWQDIGKIAFCTCRLEITVASNFERHYFINSNYSTCLYRCWTYAICQLCYSVLFKRVHCACKVVNSRNMRRKERQRQRDDSKVARQ